MPPKQGSAKKVAASTEEREFLKVAIQKTGGEKEPVSEEDDELEDEEFDEEDEEFDEDEEDDEGKTKGGNSNQVGRHMRTLFIKNLPTETTPEQVKALSIDILNVRMDVSQSKNERYPKYAILEFSDQLTAERNLQLLKGQVLNGVVFYVDFVGGPMGVTFVKPQLSPLGDPLKLYVTGFGRDVVIDQLREMFPTSSDITLPLSANDNNRPIGYAFIHFNDEAVAREAHDSMQDYVYQGRTLVVMYGKKTDTQNASLQEKRKALEDGDSSATKRSKKSDDEEDDEEDDGDEDDEEDDDLDDDEDDDEEENE